MNLYEDLQRAMSETMNSSRQLQEKMEGVTGYGEGLEGLIRITCGPGGRIENVELDYRITGHSTEELSTAIAEAHSNAMADCVRQTQERLLECGTFGETVSQLQRGEITAIEALGKQGFSVQDFLERLSYRTRT